MSWRRFAPKKWTKAHMKLCWGKGGLVDNGFSFKTEEPVDCGEDGCFFVDVLLLYPADLIVEVWGKSHEREGRRKKDDWKDSVLIKHDYKILHFWDWEINENLAGVIEKIKKHRSRKI